jgi:hypothetical protein
MTDIAGLCERLRAFHAGGYRKEAADTIERQAAEIERLRGALAAIAKRSSVMFGDRYTMTSKEAADIARAALTGEDHA